MIADRYARAVWRESSLLATWTPDRRIAVGDIVRKGPGGTLLVERKLAELVAEPLPQVTDTAAAASTLLQEGVAVKAGGDATAPVGLTRIALSGSRSFFFVGGPARLWSFETLGELRRQMTVLSGLARWEPEWHLVTAVRQHEAGTAIIAETDDVEAEIRVEGSTAVTSLAAITAGAQISVTSGRAATYTMGECTPFYEALRVRRRLSGSGVDSVTLGASRSLDDADDIEGFDVVRVTVDDIGLTG